MDVREVSSLPILACSVRVSEGISEVGSYAIPVGFPMFIRRGFTCSCIVVPEVVLIGVHVFSLGLLSGVRQGSVVGTTNSC